MKLFLHYLKTNTLANYEVQTSFFQIKLMPFEDVLTYISVHIGKM